MPIPGLPLEPPFMSTPSIRMVPFVGLDHAGDQPQQHCLPAPDGPNEDQSVSPVLHGSARTPSSTALRPLKVLDDVFEDPTLIGSSLDGAEGQALRPGSLGVGASASTGADRQDDAGGDPARTGCRLAVHEGERPHRHRLLVGARQHQREDESCSTRR